ncbi:hypothetical protein Athai_21600 [Actinocatenispora thailandica]|uniref:Uncharacterized protein n=1 Tax=Actinocatenispora thailandica TaxID=227318 RepID=A0A7R7HW30_9ACTN|nr:hypothetical protein [Actinocatenispora thailandica]BCJ34657.1 hypothetical protein Athai_21600 [Actinocatenispora thailandica]
MKRLSWWPVLVLAALCVASFALLVWGAHEAKTAYDCLTNDVYPASLGDGVCELHTPNGVRRIPLHGPGFLVTGIAGVVGTVLLVLVAVQTIRRLLRASRGEPGDPPGRGPTRPPR